MEPLEAAMIISVISDAVIRIGSGVGGKTPEEFREEVESLQVTADDLETWLREGK